MAFTKSENQASIFLVSIISKYRRLPKIDTPKIDTFYEISRNFEKVK